MDMLTGYAEVRDAGSEQAQLLAYAPLVKRIVRQLAAQGGSVIDRDDMEQIGLLGLLDALRRYGVPDGKFGAFAAMRIRGAILDELRRQDWRPRSLRQESHRTRDAVRELTRRLGHAPSDAEIMAALGLGADEYQNYLLAEQAELFASFDELIDEIGELPAAGPTPEAALVRRRSIEQALLTLDEREQRVIQLYYEFELSLREIAAVLGLTEARVCQINKGALRKMQACLR